MTTPAAPEPAPPARRAADEPPPFWSRWSRIYWFVAALLAVQMMIFWLLTRWAS